jgi:iron(II)-dependent oxidoreductase
MRITRTRTLLCILIFGLVLVIAGCALAKFAMAASGLMGSVYAAVQLTLLRRSRRPEPAPVETVIEQAPPPKPVERKPVRVEKPADVLTLVEEMLTRGRYALLLRPQLISNLTENQRARAMGLLAESMALTPEGEVALGDGGVGEEHSEDEYRQIVRVQSFFLDRYPVTNVQYHEFVAAGGYEQMSLWEPDVWPAVLDFVDRTGCVGPRFWSGGRYQRGHDDHPVVGVSWFEAAAFARWCGKRLLTDAEWVKAASWPVRLASNSRLQRKYPWGDSMDRSRANLWGSGPGCVVPVNHYPDGTSVGGVCQMIGNVWEWTSSDFDPDGARGLLLHNIVGGHSFKSLRGGAYDTYFDVQATCQFQSGDQALARKHNIGFRCALSACDLAATPPVAEASRSNPEEQPEMVEAVV